MQNAVIEILRLVADGAIGPEEGQELLDALRAGYPEEFDRPVATRPLGPILQPHHPSRLRIGAAFEVCWVRGWLVWLRWIDGRC